MPIPSVKISNFVNKAQTRGRELATLLNLQFDHGYQSKDSKNTMLMLYESRAFIRLLNTSDRGGLTDKQINDYIDFFWKWMGLNKVPMVNYTNLVNNISDNILVPSGTYALQADLATEIGNRQAGDASLDSRVTVLENSIPDANDFFPPGFFDNQVASNVNVWNDDVRLHTHSNKTQLDAITSQLLADLQALAAHYNSIGEPSGVHVSSGDRTNWNAKATTSQITALATVYAPISHVQAGADKHTIGQISGLNDVLAQIGIDIGNMAGEDGDDGREVELQLSGTVLEWRYVGDPTWNSLGDLKGDQGDPFTIDYRGQASERLSSAFDGEDESFCFLEEDTGYLFFRNPGGGAATTSAGWSTGLKFVGDNGWSPVLAIYEVNSNRAVFEVVDWVGGQGLKPAFDPGLSPPDPIRWFIGSAGLTLYHQFAVNIKGAKGTGHGPVIGASGALAGRGAYDDQIEGFIYLRTDVSPQTIYIKNTEGSADWSPEYPWQGPIGITSADLSAEVSNRVSADNALSNAVSALLSLHNVLSNRVSANSGTGGGSGSVTSAELDAASAQAASALSNRSSILQAAINAVSIAVSAETSVRAAEGLALSNKISVLSTTKADLSSPSFTGIPIVPDVSVEVSSTQIANTGFVKDSYGLIVINQVAHGLVVGDLVGINPLPEYIKWTGTVDQLLGICQKVIDANNFILRRDGVATGLTGITAGNQHYADVSAGITVSPNSNVDLFPIGIGLTTSTLLINRFTFYRNDQSNLFSNIQSAHNALSNRVSANSGTGGAGSVTSNELSAVSAQAASALSNTASALSAAGTTLSNSISNLNSAHNALSNRVSANSGIGGSGSVTSAEVVAIKQVSVEDVVSAVYTFIASDLGKVKRATLVSGTEFILPNSLSVAFNAAILRGAGAGLVFLSAEGGQTIEAIGTSIEAEGLAANVFKNGTSAWIALGALGPVSNEAGMSNTISDLQSVINALSNRVSANSGGGSGSVTSNELSAVSAQAASAISAANANLSLEISARVFQYNSQQGTNSQLFSAVSNNNSAHNALSAQVQILTAAVSELTSAHNALSNLVSGAGNLSNQVSVAQAALSNVNSAKDVLSQAVSVLSAQVAANGSFIIAVRDPGTSALTVSAATLTNITSLVLSLAAGIWRIEGHLAFEAQTSGGFAFGFSAPALGPNGTIINMNAHSVIGQNAQAGVGMGRVALSAVAAGQTAVVSVSIATINSLRGLNLEGMINVSTGGTFQLMAKTSVAAAGLLIRGGYLQAWKIV